MILTVGNIKGGVGKTTLALNLAIARAGEGYDVLLVDGDEQQTAITFTDLRTGINTRARMNGCRRCLCHCLYLCRCY